VEHFKYLGATLTNRSSIHEEWIAEWNQGMQGMLAFIRRRIFFLPLCCTKI
jgi:hypothetical protein